MGTSWQWEPTPDQATHLFIPAFPPLQWISGAGDPRNKIHILIGLSDPENPSPHKRHTIVLIPPSTKGVKVVRPLKVFGYDDAPEGHCEVLYDNVVLDEKECIVGGWGRGFEVSVGDRERSEAIS
jgi:acyl-CoA dehydrogenase